MWTFGRKVAAGFAVAFALLALIGAIAYRKPGRDLSAKCPHVGSPTC